MSFKSKLISVKDKFLDALFPNDIKCIFCGKDVPSGYICKDCLSEGIFNEGNRCIVCDTPLREDNEFCDHCKKDRKSFDRAVSPLLYDDKVRKAILQFKSDGAKYLAPYFAKLIYDKLIYENIEFDLIVPVPSYRTTIKKRGYNPARVLADELGKIANKPVEDVLYKSRKTNNQKLLDYEHRQLNLENSIILLNHSVIKNKNVLIIDDVITTCATINTCALLLTKAKSITACSVARRGKIKNN